MCKRRTLFGCLFKLGLQAPVTCRGGSKSKISLVSLISFVPVFQNFWNGQFFPDEPKKLLEKQKMASPTVITISIKPSMLLSVKNLPKYAIYNNGKISNFSRRLRCIKCPNHFNLLFRCNSIPLIRVKLKALFRT